MTNRRRKNPDLIDHVMKSGGAYKYARRVPLDLQDVLDRKVWDYYLGVEINAATKRATAYTTEHDALIAALASPEAREAFAERQEQGAAARVFALPLATAREASKPGATHDAQLVAAIAADEINPGSQINLSAPLWRRTEETMQQARALPASKERDRLALFLAYAFGDRSALDAQPADDPFGNLLAENLLPVRPSDPTGAMMWNAFRAMLISRLAELVPDTRVDTSLCIEELMELYAATKRPQTRKAYTAKVRRLTEAQGNHPPGFYTKERLQQHRDLLIADGVEPQTIAKHFETLKMLWRWAPREKSALAGLTFPDIVMPDISTSIEETRWQAYDDAEIKQVWGLVSNAWGPDSKSRLDADRRAAFLMAFRVALFTGMRPSEIFKLRSEDVKGGVLTIRETKTKGRKIPLAQPIADFADFLNRDGFRGQRVASIASTMSDQFREIIRGAGFTNDRHVLYSLKDTLVDRLQRQEGMNDDIIRGVIGHVSGQGKLRHYKTRLGDTPQGLATMRKHLDAIAYW
jgi:integrase